MTSILEGFSTYKPRGNLFISVTKYGIIISAGTLGVLNFPDTVNIYFNSATKQMAIKAEGEQNFKPQKGKNYVRWNNKRLLRVMETVAGKKLNGNRFLGEYFDDEHVVIFDFDKVKPVRKNK